MARFNRGEGIVSIKHRPKSVYDYCIVSLYNCMICLCCRPALRDIFHIPMAR